MPGPTARTKLPGCDFQLAAIREYTKHELPANFLISLHYCRFPGIVDLDDTTNQYQQISRNETEILSATIQVINMQTWNTLN